MEDRYFFEMSSFILVDEQALVVTVFTARSALPT